MRIETSFVTESGEIAARTSVRPCRIRRLKGFAPLEGLLRHRSLDRVCSRPSSARHSRTSTDARSRRDPSCRRFR